MEIEDMNYIMKPSGKPMIDLSGYEFGQFKVVKEVEPHIRNNGKKVRMWLCQCSCGNTRLLNTQEIKTEKRKSCGCMHDAYSKINNTQHGDSHTRLHNIWSGMRARCYCETDYHYKWYGGRGITICDEWKDDYCAFKEWSIANGYDRSLSIDRINNDGPYSPDNCRWVTHKTQTNNTRRNHIITANGETHTISEWSSITGIQQSTIRKRINSGKPPDDFLFPKQTDINGGDTNE